MSFNTLKTTLFGALIMSAAPLSACAQTQSSSSPDSPPAIAAPADAEAVVVTLDLQAKDAEAFKSHLLKVIPVTRQASGAQYSWSTQDPQDPTRFTLIQGWDSVEQQQGYLAWRGERGDLEEFADFLVSPPDVQVRVVFDE